MLRAHYEIRLQVLNDVKPSKVSQADVAALLRTALAKGGFSMEIQDLVGSYACPQWRRNEVAVKANLILQN